MSAKWNQEKETLIHSWVTNYQPLLIQRAFSVVRDKQLAEDTVQEVWIKVYKNIHIAKNIDNILAWLKTVTLRTAIDLLRKEKRTKEILPEEDYLENVSFYSSNNIEEAMEWKQTWLMIHDCMSNSSTKLKEVFEMKFNHGLTDKEIAKQLNISSSAVKTRIFRVRQVIKEKYEAMEEVSIQPGA